MRLSEAIRLGATMKPQCFGELFSKDGGSCAMGAAQDAAGGGILYAMYDFIVKLSDERCPECGKGRTTGRGCKHLIAHLNDVHHWTRERIADFVELHEPLPEVEELKLAEVSQVTA